MRSMVGAVIVGGNTLREDNPSLNCRLDPLPEGFSQPKAVVVTNHLPQNHEEYTLTTTRAADTIFWTNAGQAATKTASELKNKGIEVLPLPSNEKGLILEKGFTMLREKHNILRSLCEGGGRLACSLAEQGLVDEFVMYQAPRILGNIDGRPNFAGSDNALISEAMDLRISRVEQSGRDLKIVFKPEGQ